MADPAAFGESYLAAVNQLIAVVEQINLLQDRVTQDSTLFTAFLAKGTRPDLDLTAMTDANSALTQIVFTFNSGSPPQKAKLFKLL